MVIWADDFGKFLGISGEIYLSMGTQHGWVRRENPTDMDDLVAPLFWETPICTLLYDRNGINVPHMNIL